jgi:hypothetical protein
VSNKLNPNVHFLSGGLETVALDNSVYTVRYSL